MDEMNSSNILLLVVVVFIWMKQEKAPLRLRWQSSSGCSSRGWGRSSLRADHNTYCHPILKSGFWIPYHRGNFPNFPHSLPFICFVQHLFERKKKVTKIKSFFSLRRRISILHGRSRKAKFLSTVEMNIHKSIESSPSPHTNTLLTFSILTHWLCVIQVKFFIVDLSIPLPSLVVTHPGKPYKFRPT